MVNPRLSNRPFGRTGLQVSPLALADMSFSSRGLPMAGRLSPEDVERAFFDHGVTTFFVSSMFKNLCEGVRRLIRAGHREKLTLISITGFFPFAFSLRRDFEKNARAVETDTFDVFLQGWVRGAWHVHGRSWPFMQKLKQDGRARAIGFSCHDRKLALALTRELSPDVLMLRYNAAHRGVEREVFDQLGDDRPAIIAYTATRWGMLLRPVASLGFVAPMGAPECYRFVLSHPAVDTALCVPGTLANLAENVGAVNAGPLEVIRLEELRRFGDAVHQTAKGGGRFMFRQG